MRMSVDLSEKIAMKKFLPKIYNSILNWSYSFVDNHLFLTSLVCINIFNDSNQKFLL